MVPVHIETIVMIYYYGKTESVRALQPKHLGRKAAKWLYSPSTLKLHVVKEGQKKKRKRKEKEGRNEGQKKGRKKGKGRGRGREGGTSETVLNLHKRKY